MKRLLLITALATCGVCTTMAQTTRMVIKKQDGSMIAMPVDSISDVRFEPAAAASTDGLTGQWRLIASNNGQMGEGGIYTSGTDTISFTAVLSADASRLECHADRLYWRSGQDYPADFTLLVEQDGQGRRRLGWVLDEGQPASAKEFLEPKDKYLEGGFWYWGDRYQAGDDNGHRYIYLLTENIEKQTIEGMTLWSGWQSAGETSYAFPQNQQVYAIAAQLIPYGKSIGYLEIWASPRFEKLP